MENKKLYIVLDREIGDILFYTNTIESLVSWILNNADLEVQISEYYDLFDYDIKELESDMFAIADEIAYFITMEYVFIVANDSTADTLTDYDLTDFIGNSQIYGIRFEEIQCNKEY